MAIVTTDDKYYKEIANIIRWKNNLNKTYRQYFKEGTIYRYYRLLNSGL